jgi:hypothetical protein
LVLLTHVLPQVAYFIIKDLLELVPDLLDLFVFLLNHCQEFISVLLHHLLKALDLVLLFLLDPIVFFVDGVVSG